MSVKIAVNARYTARRVTGVERYAAEISRRLGSDTRLVYPNRRGGGVLGHAWEQFVLPARVGKDELLWSPANTGPLAVHQQVVTVHDLAPLEHPEWFRRSVNTAYSLILPGLVRQAAGLITLSQHTKIRIQERWQISPQQICVIPGGVDIRRFKPASASSLARLRQRYRIPGDYVLFVGTRAPHKNLNGLLNTWNELRSNYPRLILVLAGCASRVHREDPTIKHNCDNTHSQLISLNYFPEADLSTLYSGAYAYIQPSLSEGFGLTVLEAMACGAPVLASCAGGLPEAAGNCAVYFNPDEPGDLTCQLDRLLKDSSLRSNLRREGYNRATIYSWERSATSTLSYLERVAKGL